VLPARYGSTRFPGKPLAPIGGRPLIEWVYRRARDLADARAVVVATDDGRIAEAVRAFGGEVVMTRADHPTGTDRVAEVAAGLDCDVVVNLQGDEPLFDVEAVARMVAQLGARADFDMTTACHDLARAEELHDPNVVKVVVAADGRALYFSRAPIPAGAFDGAASGACARRHVGVYAFRRDALLRFANLPRTPLEISERLEQLRALEHGMAIGVVESSSLSVGVDVPEDVKSVEKLMARTYTDEA
jgi:3-deoxy-manno-octulosonate cytidylyltransferase (CMP-KDO synthetase)